MNPHATSRTHAGIRGFSLVELMITLLLAAFLISALILTFLSGRAAAGDAEQLARLQENVRILSEYLVRDIRNAGYIDEVEVLAGQEGLMLRDFGEIVGDDDDVFRVRYAGRGHCGEQFDEFVLVQNEYFVEGGVLKCRGRHVQSNTSIGSEDTWDTPGILEEPELVEQNEGVELIDGVETIQFTPLGPNGVSDCTFNYSSLPAIETACIGVQIDIGLVGLRGDIRDLSLVVAFRNIILSRVNNSILSAE